VAVTSDINCVGQRILGVDDLTTFVTEEQPVTDGVVDRLPAAAPTPSAATPNAVIRPGDRCVTLV
jgi:hypothetical protein